MGPLLFDDTYDGPRWTYGLSYRPPTTANVPAGLILFSGREHPAFPFGTIDYPHRLDPLVARQMDLVEVVL